MNPRLPHRPQARPSHRPRAFPLIPLLVACLIVVGALQGLRLAFEAGLFGTPTETTASGGRLAATVSRLSTRDDSLFEIQRRPVTLMPHHLQFGAAAQVAQHTLYVFTDPACGPCRQKLSEWLGGEPLEGVRIVYIYWPQDQADMTGGMVMEIARRESLAQPLLGRLERRRETLSPQGLMAELDGVGVSLARQQDYLKTEGADLAAVVGQDLALGIKLQLPPPPLMILDDYYLDGRVLHPARLRTYLQRLNKREPILQADDYWLNRGL